MYTGHVFCNILLTFHITLLPPGDDLTLLKLPRDSKTLKRPLRGQPISFMWLKYMFVSFQFNKIHFHEVHMLFFIFLCVGCLVITLYGVKELKKALCEAYCIVQVDDAATKRIGTTMQTCKGTTTWNQCFEVSTITIASLFAKLS